MRERILVQRARRGDLPAFNQLVAEYEAIAFGLVYRLLGDKPTAEQIVHQSVLRAFQGMDEFQGERFLCWLLRVIVNACRDRQASIVSQARIPASQIEQNLGLLPFEQRLAILLSDVHGFSRQEIAFIMGIPDEMARAAVHNARLSLRNVTFGPPRVSLGRGQDSRPEAAFILQSDWSSYQ